MLISISGKIGSGKDTIGQIIQYLISRKGDTRNLKILSAEFKGLTDSNWLAISQQQSWEIHKWADSLKEILCIMTGTTREQWEDSTFKEKELPQEWWYWKLEREGGYGTTLIPYPASKEELMQYEGLKLIKPTPRLLMQLLATECCRDIIHPNIWINALMSKYKEFGLPCVSINNESCCNEDGSCKTTYPNWIITDTRFPNELKAIKDKEGITIRVNRGKAFEEKEVKTNVYNNPEKYSKPQKIIGYSTTILKEHESETALDNAEFDYVIYNTGTIEDLIDAVKGILEQEKII